MSKAKFSKGQTVFYACTGFASVAVGKDNTIELRVIARIVDACGLKQVTFVDRGNDGIYGRKFSFGPYSKQVFATAEEAFSYLESHKAKWTRTEKTHSCFAYDTQSFVITPEVQTDAEVKPSIIK
jgi:hypothetical protein